MNQNEKPSSDPNPTSCHEIIHDVEQESSGDLAPLVSSV